jgi:putative SOS response-associated peptidase YedK
MLNGLSTRVMRGPCHKFQLKEAWAKGQRCIIPTESFYEPNYESGKAVRWNIQQPGEVPMGIAAFIIN